MSARERTPRVQIVAVGRMRPPLQEAAEEFGRRVDRRLGLRVDEVNPEPLQRGEDHARAAEAARIRARLVRGAWTVALDPDAPAPRGSEAFAAWLRRRIESGRPLALVMGGPSGIDPTLRAECDEAMGLGPLTMPHQLARVVLVEQLYRAQCTIDGHPYPH